MCCLICYLFHSFQRNLHKGWRHFWLVFWVRVAGASPGGVAGACCAGRGGDSTWQRGHGALPIICSSAGVVQWQDLSFPSSRRGFDSHRPLQFFCRLWRCAHPPEIDCVHVCVGLRVAQPARGCTRRGKNAVAAPPAAWRGFLGWQALCQRPGQSAGCLWRGGLRLPVPVPVPVPVPGASCPALHVLCPVFYFPGLLNCI